MTKFIQFTGRDVENPWLEAHMLQLSKSLAIQF